MLNGEKYGRLIEQTGCHSIWGTICKYDIFTVCVYIYINMCLIFRHMLVRKTSKNTSGLGLFSREEWLLKTNKQHMIDINSR
jgi:hypothetical protein